MVHPPVEAEGWWQLVVAKVGVELVGSASGAEVALEVLGVKVVVVGQHLGEMAEGPRGGGGGGGIAAGDGRSPASSPSPFHIGATSFAHGHRPDD